MWEEEQEYSAKIGGLLYRNIKNPIVVNGKSLIKFFRNSESGILGASLQIAGDRGQLLCRVDKNNVDIVCKDLSVIRGANRVSVLNNKTSQVVLDLSYEVQNEDYEIQISFQHLLDSYPIVFHPERTKFGYFNNNLPPNISELTLCGEKGSQSTGINIKSKIRYYLLNIGIENFLNGIIVTVDEKISSK